MFVQFELLFFTINFGIFWAVRLLMRRSKKGTLQTIPSEDLNDFGTQTSWLKPNVQLRSNFVLKFEMKN